MKRLSSILLSFALLSPVPSAFAQPSPSHVIDEDTILQRISDLEALVRSLTTLIESLSARIGNESSTITTTPPVSTTPSVTTPPVNTTSGPTITVDDPNKAVGSIDGYGYWMVIDPPISALNNPRLGSTFLRNNDEFNVDLRGRTFDLSRNKGFGGVTYQKDDGFHGFYRHSNGNDGTIISDVQLRLNFMGNNTHSISSLEIGAKNPIVIEGVNLGSINGLAKYSFQNILTSAGGFNDERYYNVFDNVFYSTGEVLGSFSDQLTTEDPSRPFPIRAGGFVAVRWTDRGVSASNKQENSLTGVFVADLVEPE